MELNASSHGYEQRVKLVDVLLTNMKGQAQSTQKAGVMLAGDPGVGKTSFIKFFATLVGMPLVTIEAPHITEEHIINIPFIVWNPATGREEAGETESKFDSSNFSVVLADSNLFSKLKTLKVMPDKNYLKSIYSGPADLIKIFEELGGDKDTIPDEIAEIRENHQSILFLDEYFRQTSPKIRNMLRGILNGKLGVHDLPKSVYVVYASNLVDSGGGVEGEIPRNNDFEQVDMAAPNKDDWFSWLVSKFENDKHVKLDPKIVKKFYDILEDEDLNHNDTSNDLEIRTSPRRWEQILLYINSSLPCKDEKEAKSLLTNIKSGLTHYLTGDTSTLAVKILGAISELIKETSDIEIGADAENSAEEWKDTLEHQIKQKMKIGDARKYIPIVSGEPGIGKTTHAQAIAKDLDLRYIYIDCSLLNAEDVVGLPLPKGGDSKKIETQFSAPTLYSQIIDEAKRADKDHIEYIKSKVKGTEAKEAIKKYEETEWKYLVFFDEINRNNSKVFNGIRKLLLEKSFGEEFQLPKGSVVMAALNPKDVSASELTDHMRDVVDIIDAKANFAKTQEILKNLPFKSLKNEKSRDVVYDVLMKFIDKFRVKSASKSIPLKQRSYYLDIGASPVYFSPREISDLYSTATIAFDSKAHRMLSKTPAGDSENEHLEKTEKALRDTLYDSFKRKLSWIFTKHEGMQAPEFLHDLQDWFMHSSDLDFGEGIFYKKAKTVSVESILSKFFQNPSDTEHLSDEMDFVSYIQNHDSGKFKEELSTFLISQFEKDADVVEKLLDKKYKAKSTEEGKIKFEEKEVSKFEHLVREMVNAIEIHKLSGEHREVIRQAVREALKHIRVTHGAEHIEEFLDFNAAVLSFIKGIK